MKKFSRLACFSLLILVTGCSIKIQGVPGSGVSKTEDRQVEAFESIEFRGAGTIEVAFNNVPGLSLTTDDNLLERIKTEVKDGKLIVSPTEPINPKVSLVLKVTTQKLTKVKLEGAGVIDVKDIDGERLELDIEGAGTAKATGKVRKLIVDISGAGSAKLKDLEAEDVEVSLSGAGSAQVHASQSFDGDVSGVGSIKCYGNPEDKKKDVSGIGNIKFVEGK